MDIGATGAMRCATGMAFCRHFTSLRHGVARPPPVLPVMAGVSNDIGVLHVYAHIPRPAFRGVPPYMYNDVAQRAFPCKFGAMGLPDLFMMAKCRKSNFCLPTALS